MAGRASGPISGNRLKRGIRLAFALLDRTRRYLLLVAGLPATKEFLVLRCRGETACSPNSPRCSVRCVITRNGNRIYRLARGFRRIAACIATPRMATIGGSMISSASTSAATRRPCSWPSAIGSTIVSPPMEATAVRRAARWTCRIRPPCPAESAHPKHRRGICPRLVFRNSFVIGVHYRGTDKHEDAPHFRLGPRRGSRRDEPRANRELQAVSCNRRTGVSRLHAGGISRNPFLSQDAPLG